MAREKTVHLRLRIPEELRGRLERDAKRNNRSMNAEIIRRLEQSFYQYDRDSFAKAAAISAARAIVADGESRLSEGDRQLKVRAAELEMHEAHLTRKAEELAIKQNYLSGLQSRLEREEPPPFSTQTMSFVSEAAFFHA